MNNQFEPHTVNNSKNRNRDKFSFANINLLGKCNVQCFFCLGEDLHDELARHNQVKIPFIEWDNFYKFLKVCKKNNIKKIYITGQNTDSLLYKHLEELIDELHHWEFEVGLRTNGYLANERMDIINKCRLSTGYSIHSINPATNKMIMGTAKLPDWKTVIPSTERPRIAIVVNRCNAGEFWDTLKYVAKFNNLRYIQIRRISTDTRLDFLAHDIIEYERIYTQVSNIFPLKEKLWHDAEVYEIYGQDVVFWRTTKTSINSINYFTDGTISEEYFIVEGYLKNRS